MYLVRQSDHIQDCIATDLDMDFIISCSMRIIMTKSVKHRCSADYGMMTSELNLE